MIPIVNDDTLFDFEIKKQPSKTYKLNEDSIDGTCDNLEAIKQAIYLILNIERYNYVIYSWNYGIELKDLFGQPTSYAIPELERRIKEALIQDDRIENVDEFEFEINKNKVYVKFTVHTTCGEINAEKVVNL